MMRPWIAFLVLFAAAVLEAGGDAIVRRGLHGQDGLAARIGLIAVGGLVLLGYGVTVNLPPWDFGRLLGIYVTLFFLVAQLINFFVFGVTPSLPVLLGGALVIAGGLVMTFWKT
jgi:drug/metabolite transporter superfamily protein YnfA